MMGVQQFVFCGGLWAAMSVGLISAVKTEIMIPLYEFPNSASTSMWIGLRDAAADGMSITGIMNPNSGPLADEGSELGYKNFLRDVMGLGDGALYEPTQTKPTILCYIATGYGDQGTRPKSLIESSIQEYDTRYPGVCDGIFYDEAVSDGLTELTDDGDVVLTTVGQFYHDYNALAIAAGKSVTFNPGTAAEPVYFGWDGPPTVMSFENKYSLIKTVGITRAPASTPEQNAMYVHGAKEVAGDSSLVKAMVEKAACSGWGKVYFTTSAIDDTDGNPWNENTLFWDELVAEVSQDIDITCADSDQSRMRIMVPLLPNPVPNAAGMSDMVAPVLDVLSKSDYGDVVSVVLDASDGTVEDAAVVLRDAGARIMCYLDAAGLTETNDLSTSVYTLPDVCGGFFIDNFDTKSITEGDINDLYANAQYKAPRCTVVFKPADASATQNEYFHTNNWDKVSFQIGRVVVATVIDGTTSTTIPSAGGDRGNSAAMMTGFNGIPAECAIADMAAASYGYAYVTEAADFAALSSYWAKLVSETSDPSASSSYSCDSPVSPTPVPDMPTPPPTTPSEPGLTACGSEPESTMTWLASSRKLRIQGEGCADMTRMLAYLTAQGITDVLSQVETGVWELDGTLDVRVGSTAKIIGQDSGECDELRLISNSPRSRVLGIGGDIVIQDTQVFGWKDGAKDTAETSDRGYIYCASCSGSSDQCTMSVTDSTIGNLGSGGVNSGGLAWKDLCTDTSSAASAQRVTVADNRRGIYARGVVLDFDDVTVTGGTTISIHVDTCSGQISNSEVSPPPSTWGIYSQRSGGIQIASNTLIGTRGLYMANADGVEVTGNAFDESSAAVRIRTTETLYSGNTGDGVYGSSSRVGVRVQKGGCFAEGSTSDDAVVDAYLTSGNRPC